MLRPKEINQGFYYFVMGWHLITQKGLRRFVIMPILLNILLFAGLLWLFVINIVGVIEGIMNYIPTWLAWLSGVLLAFSIFTMLVLFSFAFSTLASFIAAPFNGLLAEKVEKMLTGENLVETNTMGFIKDIPRMLGREWQKLCYSLPRLIGLFLLSFIPVLGQLVVPILTFLFTAWMMAIQYCDYPFDNHKIPFSIMRNELGEKRTLSLTFGSLVTCCTCVPIVNFVIIPVAVCGATAMWVNQYRDSALFNFKTRDGQTRRGGDLNLTNQTKTINHQQDKFLK